MKKNPAFETCNNDLLRPGDIERFTGREVAAVEIGSLVRVTYTDGTDALLRPLGSTQLVRR